MKRNLLVVGIATIMSLFLASCGGNYPEELWGVYETKDGSLLILSENGEAGEQNNFGKFERTWHVENDELCLVSDEGVETCGKYTLSGNQLTWEIMGMKINYTKTMTLEKLKEVMEQQAQ